MKKLIVSLVLASSALVAAAPASAQYYRDRPYDSRHDGYGERFHRNNWLGQRLDRIGYAIQQGIQRGTITPREARRLHAEHSNLWRVAQRYYADDGLNGWERNDLNRRLAMLQRDVQIDRRDGDRRWRY